MSKSPIVKSDEVSTSSANMADIKKRKRAANTAPESNEEVIILTTQKKPDFSKRADSTLRDRLTLFLPELANANTALTGEDNIEDVEEDQQHIDMELGLGVLQEASTSGSDSSTDSDEDSVNKEKPGDAMIELTGSKQPQQKGLIQEVASSDA